MSYVSTNNDALWIALQSGVACYVEGAPGTGKTKVISQFMRMLEVKPIVYCPSHHGDEDICGMPDTDPETRRQVTCYQDWLYDLQNPGRGLILDELPCSGPRKRPPLLSILQEGVIGTGESRIELAPGTMRCGIGNPPEQSPNGTPLEASLCNRLYHHQWVLPFQSWFDGMMACGNFENTLRFPVVGDTSGHKPAWYRLIANLLKRHPELREVAEIDDETTAFLSLRQWHRLADCLAAASQVQADADVHHQLAAGMVGKDGAEMLMAAKGKSLLYDPAEVVDGKVSVTYDDRLDRLWFLPSGIIDTLTDDGNPARVERAYDVLIEMGEHGLLDPVAPVIGFCRKTFGEMSEDQRVRMGELGAALTA